MDRARVAKLLCRTEGAGQCRVSRPQRLTVVLRKSISAVKDTRLMAMQTYCSVLRLPYVSTFFVSLLLPLSEADATQFVPPLFKSPGTMAAAPHGFENGLLISYQALETREDHRWSRSA